MQPSAKCEDKHLPLIIKCSSRAHRQSAWESEHICRANERTSQVNLNVNIDFNEFVVQYMYIQNKYSRLCFCVTTKYLQPFPIYNMCYYFAQ